MLNKAYRAIHKLEDGVLIFLVVLMIFLACLQIIIRNTGINGGTWTGTALQVNVLWLAFFGALRASREQSHVSIDVIYNYIGPKWQNILNFFASLLSCVICLIATYYSYLYMVFFSLDSGEETYRIDLSFPCDAPNFFLEMFYTCGEPAIFSVPTWLCEIIIPIALFIMAIRFFVQALRPMDTDESIN